MTRKANLDSWISGAPNLDGYYEAKVWMGTKGDGEPDRRHVQRKSLASVKARVKELEAQRDAGRVTRAGRAPTVREMLERHLTVVLPGRGRAPRTIADYRSKCRNDIFPRWGGQRIDRLRRDQIEDGLAEMLDTHAASHVRKVHAILSSAFEDQVKNGTVKRNPLEHITAPPADEPDVTALTQAQAQNIAAVAMSRPNGVRWSVGLATGLRQGEALGLRWSFIDLDTGWMRIWHQLQRLAWEHGCDDPHACGARHHRNPCPVPCPKAKRKQGRKHVCPAPGGVTRSESGTRGKLCPPDCAGHARYCPQRKLPRGCTEISGGLVLRPIKEKRRKRVKLPRELLPALKAHRDAQYLRSLTADKEWEENDLVFTQWNGRPVDPRRDWGEWQSILADAGMPPQRLHIMRHTAATIMLERGVAIAVVMQALGHSDIRITSRYSHASEGLLEDAADRVGDLYAFDNETITGTKNGPDSQDR
jgi:integrase